MAFWKKSEDPWDVEPEKRRPVPAENGEKGPGLLDQLQDWNEARKAEKARRETPPPPIPCPWCGKTMETGYLMGNRGIWWAPGRPDAWAKWVSVAAAEGAFQVDTEGGLATYRTAWHCPDCGKLVLDVRPGSDDISQSDRDCEEELRGYAQQANKREGEN